MNSLSAPPVDDPSISSPHPDQFTLRCLVYLSFIGVVVGCIAGADSNVGRWIVLVSLGVGVVSVLAHLLEMLTRRLRTRTAEFLGLLVAFSIFLVFFSNSAAIFSGAPEGVARSLYIIPLAAALLVLLLRATVLARCAAPFLPLGLSRTITLKRGGGVLLKEEMVVPPRWVYALYWFSPVGWWLLATLLIVSHTLTVESWLMLSAIGVLACALAVRILLGLAAWVRAFNAWREAASTDDPALAREAKWYLGLNGLTVGGLVVFYAFAVAGNRFLDEALDGSAHARVEQIVAEMDHLNPPPIIKDQSSRNSYVQASSYYPKPGNEYIFDRAWATPGAAIHKRWCADVLRNLPCDKSGPAEFYQVPDKGLRNWQESSRQTVANNLILHERYAAEDGNWDVIGIDTMAALVMARHTREVPFINRWELGCTIEHQSLMGLVASAFWTENSSPTDATLETTQRMVREQLEDRGPSLIWHVRLVCLYRLILSYKHEKLDDPHGNLSLADLIKCWSVVTWRKQNNLYRFTQDVLPDYEHGYLEVQRHDLLQRARKFGDCDGLCDIPKKLPEYLDLELKTICEFRMADAALAVARYKNKNHYWPKTLQDCVPEFLPLVPADPFNPKEPLRFAVEPARIYSVGHATGYHPENHGGYPFTSRVLMNDVFARDNLVLFLGNPGVFRSLPDGAPELPGVDIPGEISNLKSTIIEDRHAAMRRLACVGAKVAMGADALVERLKNGDVEERMYAAYILGRCGVKSDAVLSALRAARLDAEADVRFFVRQALRKLE